MSVPAQVLRQSAAAEELMKALNEDPDAPKEQEGQEGNQPEADSGVERAPQPERLEQPAGNTDNFEQKYRTLQGMFNAEQARNRSEVLQAQQKISQLETLLSQITSQPQHQQADQPTSYVTEQDRAEYSESLDVMRRVSKEEVAPIMARLATIEQALRAVQTNVVPRIEQVASRQAQSAEQRFWTELATLVPDWQVVNANSNWLDWLNQTDPVVGLTRQALLEDARASLDVNRVAAIFSAWKGVNGHTAQPSRGAASQLEKQEAPGRSRGGQPPVAPQTKTYTSQDIQKFYEDVRKGAYQGREAERARIEKEIFDAAASRTG